MLMMTSQNLKSVDFTIQKSRYLKNKILFLLQIKKKSLIPHEGLPYGKNSFVAEIIFKVCVCYIFASLFFMSEREHLWNKEVCFLFHFESSFCSWDNQILKFKVFKVLKSSCHQMLKHETQYTFYRITWKVTSAW